MTIWATILGMAAVTFLTRALGIFALGRDLPRWLRRWLSHVPVAVFTALALPALLVQGGAAGGRLVLGPGLAAGVAGAAVAWRTASPIATIACGLLVFWALRWLGM